MLRARIMIIDSESEQGLLDEFRILPLETEVHEGYKEYFFRFSYHELDGMRFKENKLNKALNDMYNRKVLSNIKR